jgi:hypothetical protein
VALTPHGALFEKALKLSLPVDRDGDLVAYYLEDEDAAEWQRLGPASVRDERASVALDHFSIVMCAAHASEPGPRRPHLGQHVHHRRARQPATKHTRLSVAANTAR